MQLKSRKWDGKWRIIIYDIFSGKKQERELFRKTLKQLRFLQLQKSIYLTPFPCYDEIEYLRQVCDVGKEVIMLTVSGLENESVYKEYFNL
jgi:phenylacetic acid degradation operon negative regulatory protein